MSIASIGRRAHLCAIAALISLTTASAAIAQPTVPSGSPRPLSSPLQSGLSVLPIRLELSSDAPTGEITVENGTDDPVQFQVTGFAWDESVAGVTTLTATRDLIFYPTIFSLAPGGTQLIRVGVEGSSSASERTFRIYVTQLPPSRATVASKVASLGFQTSFGIPIFVDPENPTRSLIISQATIQGQKLSVHVHNAGSGYDMVTAIIATGLDSNGVTLFTAKGAGWYVLAGHDRVFTIGVPSGDCSSVRSVRFDISSEWGGTKGTLPLTGSCKR